MLHERLAALDRPIMAGIAGSGEFGREITTQAARMRNLTIAIIADLVPARAVQAFRLAGTRDEYIGLAESPKGAASLLERGLRVVVEDASILTELPLDIVCDATGEPGFGAEFAAKALRSGKHVVAVNVEAEMTVGPALSALAREAGLVYTEAEGDQPSLITGLWDWATTLGLEVVAAGKWTKLIPPHMRGASGSRVQIGYEDGSKNQVELCCVANATGLPPDVRGMHLPSLGLDELPRIFRERSRGGILGRSGVVDGVNVLAPEGSGFVEPRLGGGVFLVIRSGDPVFKAVAVKKGFVTADDGEHVLVYRPYHFVGIEAPISMVRAVLDREATASPRELPTAEVVAVAKRRLEEGERLDGIGGLTVRGLIERADIAARDNLLPLGLAEGISVRRPVEEGEALSYADLEGLGEGEIWRLRRIQDEAYARNAAPIGDVSGRSER